MIRDYAQSFDFRLVFLFIGLNVYDDVAFSLLLEIILPHFFSSDILFCLLLMK